nr:hypothetical protein StreXyl84_08230 [Streptomyces sp. Xyl84]
MTGRASRTSRPSPAPGAPPRGLPPRGVPSPPGALPGSPRSPLGGPPLASPLLTSRRHIDLLRVCSALGARATASGVLAAPTPLSALGALR